MTKSHALEDRRSVPDVPLPAPSVLLLRPSGPLSTRIPSPRSRGLTASLEAGPWPTLAECLIPP